MADAVIISAGLDTTALDRAINKLVNDVENKLDTAAHQFEKNIGRMQIALDSLARNARTRVADIQQSFTAMGTTFQDFATAMERAARAASSTPTGGGTGGRSGSSGGGYGEDTVGALKESIRSWEVLQNQANIYENELKVINNIIERLKLQLKEVTKGQQKLNEEQLRSHKQSIGQAMRNATSLPMDTISEAERRLSRLKKLIEVPQSFNLLRESDINRINTAIAKTEQQLTKLRAKAAIPTTTNGVLGMSERTLNDISAKMKAINDLRNTLPTNSTEISRLNAEYARLSKTQSEILGKNARLIESNKSLARAFSYIRNRLAFMITVGAFTGFVRQLYEVRGQYELLERSLGVLLNSFQRGSQVFQELNAMAIKSPFTLIELGTAAKQLTAYNFKANEVVNTTKRMADIAAAVGVPMERLVYNLGQIRAQTVLTARDARDFANAGLPIASSLADMYTKLEGRVVSTGDVFDRMKKKAVSYNDVMSVLNEMTDEGGKFFDFQAKQAGTLKVQLANLNLAWNNMLNSIGESNQKLLSLPITGLKAFFEGWQGISDVIKSTVIALGSYKAIQFVINRLVGISATQLDYMVKAENRAIVAKYERIKATRALTQAESAEYVTAKVTLASKKAWIAADYELALVEKNLTTNQAMRLVTMNKTNVELHKALINMGLLTEEQKVAALQTKKWTLAWNLFVAGLKGVGTALKSIFMATWPMLLIGAIFEIIFAIQNADAAIKEINKDIIEGAKETADTLKKFATEYDNVRKSLYEYDVKDPTVEIGKRDLPQDEAQKAWETMRTKIEESVSSANTFIAKLESIEDVNERLRVGFGLVDSLSDAEGKLQKIEEDAIKVSTTTWKGMFGEGLKDDIKDYIESFEVLERQFGSVAEAEKKLSEQPIAVGLGNVLYDIQEVNNEITKVAESMAKTFNSEELNLGMDAQRMAFEQAVQSIAEKQELTTEQIKVLRIKAEHEYYESTKAIYEKLLETQTGDARKATKEKLHQLQLEFNTNKSLQETFFQWLSDTRNAETTKMLQNLTKEEIAAGKWMKDENIAWIKEQAQAFSKEYGTSFDDLYTYVKYANTWKIYIPVYFQTIGQLTDLQKSFKDLGISEQYYKDAESTHELLAQLKKDQKKVAEEIDAVNRAKKGSIKYNDYYLQGLEQQNKSLTDQIHSLQGLTDAEENALKKQNKLNNKKNSAARSAQAKAESELAKALKEELQIIDKVQSAYKSLTKSGASRQEALEISTTGFEKSANAINAIFKKWGLEQFDIKKFAGLNNPRELMDMLQKQLDKLVASGKAKPEEIKDLELKIRDLRVEANKFDLEAITKGLNNELDKIKEEYELGVELDANPELGSIFADMMGISKEEIMDIPRDFQGVLKRMQQAIDATLGDGKFSLTDNLNKSNFDAWVTEQGNTLEDGFAQALDKIREYVNKVRLDENKKIISDWQNLLEKYAEYETKKAKIQRKAEQEREAARKHGASQEIFDAIDLKELREIEKLNFDEFQKSATWITATGDISNLTDKALQMLIDRLWEYKKAAKNLDPKEIIRLNNALRKLRKEQKKDNPFAAWSIMLDEAKQRMEQYEPDIDELTRKIQNLLKKQAQQHGILSDEDNQTLGEYLKNLEKLRKEQNEVGKLTLGDKLSVIQKYSNAIKDVIDSIINIANGIGAKKISQAAEALKDVLGIVDKAKSGYELGGKYGAIAGAVLGITEMLIRWFDGNEDINDQIVYSQRQVKKLENQYKDLQHAMEEAYGDAKYGAQQAMIYNKKLQLEQLENQLRLEKSRKSKHKDEDAIISLEGQIIDLKNEIHDAINSIVTDMLGISSVSDAAENVVKSMIEAFKSGEDYMKVFEDSFEDMIDNMIAKTIVSRLIGDFIQGIFDQIKAKKVENASGIADSLSYAQSVLQGLYDFANEFGMTDSLQQQINEWEENVKRLQDAYKMAITPTPEDIAELQETVAAGKASIKEGFDAWMAAFGVQFGQNAGEMQLSSLQQGIQGITEETAGALEAYMNGVSQQVYYQSDILTQIRDILVNFGGDVTLATNSQILFELQQSYQVQMTIQSILQGWSTPSGLAVRVEMQ